MGDIIMGTDVKQMQEMEASGAEIILSDGQRLQADCVIATLAPQHLKELLDASGFNLSFSGNSDASICNNLLDTSMEDVGVVGVSFDNDIFRGGFSGAGYFCGSREQQGILAMSWDSQLFPEQGAGNNGSHLTVYVDGEGTGGATSMEDIAMQAVRSHLNVDKDPLEVRSTLCKGIMPKYIVGHHSRMRNFNKARVRQLPWLQVAGAGFFGPRTPADEIVDARVLTDSLSRRFARFPGLIENETEEDVADRYGGGFDTQ